MEGLIPAQNLIEKSQNISIYLPETQSVSLTEGDAFCAASALFYSLKKINKNVNLFLERVPKKFEFLASSKFIISLKTKKKDVAEVSYEKNGKELKILLTATDGDLSSEDFSFSSQNFPQNLEEADSELLITLGSQSMEELGSRFSKNPNLFYQTPLINIDNNPSNQGFGEVNLIRIKDCSISETVIDLVQTLEEESGQPILDENIATFLLAGIIWASENFRNPKTTPQTFKKASFLIEKGGDHQKIIQNFYKQKPIAQIKLLGQVLKKLTFNQEKELYVANLTAQDFKDSEASSRDLAGALQELKFNFGDSLFSNFLLLWESHASPVLIKGIFYSPRSDLTEKILANFEGVSRGRTTLFLIRGEDLNAAYQKFLKAL